MNLKRPSRKSRRPSSINRRRSNLAIETAQRYGFTLEELGPAMARQELDKQAQQLYKDFEILNSAGIKSVAITERMADSVNQYVQDALAMGAEIPSAMRPMLEQFAKAGTLLDANGNAITDLEDAGISFALTMSEGFKELIGEVRKLTDAISRGLSGAIEDIPEIDVRARSSALQDQGRELPEGHQRLQELRHRHTGRAPRLGSGGSA